MAICKKCGEWAGIGGDQHTSCQPKTGSHAQRIAANLDKQAQNLYGRPVWLRALFILVGTLPALVSFRSMGIYDEPFAPLLELVAGPAIGAYIADLIICRYRVAALTAMLIVAQTTDSTERKDG